MSRLKRFSIRLRPTWSFSSTMPQAEWRPQQKVHFGRAGAYRTYRLSLPYS